MIIDNGIVIPALTARRQDVNAIVIVRGKQSCVEVTIRLSICPGTNPFGRLETRT